MYTYFLLIDKINKGANKMANKIRRENSTQEYLDELQDRYSKLNVIRVDLAYKKDSNNKITLEKANEDLERMLNNRRSKPSIFKDQVGYVCKKEYTEDRGVHIHAYFFYDGQKVKKSSFKADQIGKYWKENITKDKGSYHNSHRNKYTDNAIGMLEHNDTDKRKKLDKAISYLYKNEQSINPIKTNKKSRAFCRGILPKKKKSTGRPRKTNDDN